MAWWIWVLAAFVLLALEFATTTLHVAFFAVGALAVAALQGLGVELPLWGQLAVFTVVSLTAFFLIRPMIMRKLKLTEAKVVDSIVGEYAIAMDVIAPGGIGKADLRGASWNARNIGAAPISAGERCAVQRIEGLVLQIQGSAV
jgi:membrane protein implicated in regulation of membrane protease activity